MQNIHKIIVIYIPIDIKKKSYSDYSIIIIPNNKHYCIYLKYILKNSEYFVLSRNTFNSMSILYLNNPVGKSTLIYMVFYNDYNQKFYPNKLPFSYYQNCTFSYQMAALVTKNIIMV